MAAATPTGSSLHSYQLHEDVVALPLNAVVYTVVDVDTTDADFSVTLWMSESSMLSGSLTASQLVAVSVCHESSDHTKTHHVENLEKRCSREFGLTGSGLVNEAGSYCAIASVWPSGKLKDGVKLSKQLSFSLGCSQPGIKISVNALKCSTPDNIKVISYNKTTMDANVHNCLKLILRWCPVDGKGEPAGIIKDSISVRATCEPGRIVSKSNKKSRWKVVAKVDEENQNLKHGLGIGKSISPQKTDCSRRMWLSNDGNTLTEILADKTQRAAKLVQKYAVRLLHDRYLMKGNVVGILLCGCYCIFKVVDAELLAIDHADENAKDEKNPGLPWIQVPNVFHIGSNTHVEFILHSTSSTKQFNSDCNAPYVKEVSPLAEQIMLLSKNSDFSSLGGLSEQITILKEIIKFSLLQPERLISLGLHPPHGVLLYGPPGTGKTSLALASAAEAGVNIFQINGPEIVNEYYGESEAALQLVFSRAQEAAPAMVFIDELDAIAPQRTNGSEDLGRRLVATLLTIMDGSEKYLHHVLVVAATNRPETIDSALRRPGRFDREIEISVPTPAGRREIFLSHLSRMRHKLTDENISSLAATTHGFVGADISSLCNEAAMIALRRYVQGDDKCEGWTEAIRHRNESQIPFELSNIALGLRNLNISTASGWSEDSLRIRMTDFEEAKTKVRPSGMREVMLEVPKVHWSDIGGHEEIKQRLQEAVLWPQKHNDAFSRIGTQPPRGVLLYGPPGCSKTLMARAVATEAGLNFIAVKGPELFSKWVGESEKAVRSLFQRARVAAPSVVFFDELDGLAVLRGAHGASVGDRVMSQLLVEMDGLSPRNGVTVIAATNRPDKIDSALLRPGRFDKLLFVGPPDEAARFQIFEIHTRNMPCGSDVDKKFLAMRTNGYTGADIAGVCREAAMAALEEDLNAKEVSMRHFSLSLKSVQKSVSEVSESMYLKFSRGLTTSIM